MKCILNVVNRCSALWSLNFFLGLCLLTLGQPVRNKSAAAAPIVRNPRLLPGSCETGEMRDFALFASLVVGMDWKVNTHQDAGHLRSHSPQKFLPPPDEISE